MGFKSQPSWCLTSPTFCSLQALPPFKGKLYRGVNCWMRSDQYRPGDSVCWPAFSSASQSQTVADDCAKGAEATLFCLQSHTGKAIAMVSRYPEEAEVLFGPNTVFKTITRDQFRPEASGAGPSSCPADYIAMQVVGGGAGSGNGRGCG